VQIEQLQEMEWAATAAKKQAQHGLTSLAEETAEGRGNRHIQQTAHAHTVMLKLKALPTSKSQAGIICGLSALLAQTFISCGSCLLFGCTR
jgi:hypothetical protein